MSSDDIANLYRQFGGDSADYQELGRDNVVRQSRERWPLLAQVRQQDAARAALRPASGDTARAVPAAGEPVAPVFDEATAAAAARAAQDRPPVARPRPPAPANLPATPGPQIAARPVEPTLTAAPLAPAAAAAALPPFARPVAPATAFPQQGVAAPAPAGNELQGLFARLARAPEPPAAPADRDVSLLRRLLRS